MSLEIKTRHTEKIDPKAKIAGERMMFTADGSTPSVRANESRIAGSCSPSRGRSAITVASTLCTR